MSDNMPEFRARQNGRRTALCREPRHLQNCRRPGNEPVFTVLTCAVREEPALPAQAGDSAGGSVGAGTWLMVACVKMTGAEAWLVEAAAKPIGRPASLLKSRKTVV